MSDLNDVYTMVYEYFEGDSVRIAMWFKTANPHLGELSPEDMIKLGRTKKLKQTVQNLVNGDIP